MLLYQLCVLILSQYLRFIHTERAIRIFDYLLIALNHAVRSYVIGALCLFIGCRITVFNFSGTTRLASLK